MWEFKFNVILDIQLWSIDSCQNEVSADQYQVTVSWAQVFNSLR